MSEFPLGRRVPTDFEHVEKYPLRSILPATVAVVNKTLSLPSWHWSHDQGREGACVGYGSSMMMSILNRRRYDAHWLWNAAKVVDEWPDTNPGDDNGTSVRASCDVLRLTGHRRILHGKTFPASPQDGILTNRWATTVDEMRTALSMGIPVSIGINWYRSFDMPIHPDGINTEWWIGLGAYGQLRGGHCVCVYGANDGRGAFRIKNSWGKNYPLVWMPYATMQRLLNEQGEATLVVDR